MALRMHGINPVENKFLTNFEYKTINKHATKVVKEPKTISIGPTEEAKLDNKQPIVKPTVKLGLKKTNKFKSSEILNCINS